MLEEHNITAPKAQYNLKNYNNIISTFTNSLNCVKIASEARMGRIKDEDIHNDLIETLAERCASDYAKKLLAGEKRVTNDLSANLILNCSADEGESLFALFTDGKGRAKDKVKLSGQDVIRTLDDPRALVSAAANFKASHIALCVASRFGKVKDEAVAAACEYLLGQKKVRLDEFIFIGDGRAFSLVRGGRIKSGKIR